MKLTIITGIAVFITTGLFAQDVVLRQNVAADTVPPEWGPNLKHYLHLYLGEGLIIGAPEGPGADIRYGNSTNFHVGFRYKRRLSNFYALGFDLSYGISSFNLKQDSSKILPGSILHDKEKLNFNHAGILIYNRFNFGKRGNFIGDFFDLGAYANWEFAIKHIYTDRHFVPNSDKAMVTNVSNSGLIYTNPYNYGIQGRIGINRFAIYCSYRLSNLFKASFPYPELPRIIAGLQIGLHG